MRGEPRRQLERIVIAWLIGRAFTVSGSLLLLLLTIFSLEQLIVRVIKDVF
jgi:hypothetical protein